MYYWINLGLIILGGYATFTLVEYWIHRLMHIFKVQGHIEHHKNVLGDVSQALDWLGAGLFIVTQILIALYIPTEHQWDIIIYSTSIILSYVYSK